MKSLIFGLAFLSFSSFARNMHLVEFNADSPQERSLIGNIIHLGFHHT